MGGIGQNSLLSDRNRSVPKKERETHGVDFG